MSVNIGGAAKTGPDACNHDSVMPPCNGCSLALSCAVDGVSCKAFRNYVTNSTRSYVKWTPSMRGKELKKETVDDVA